MWGAGWTYSEYSAGQNEGPEAVSGLFAFIPPPKGSGCSRSGYKVAREGEQEVSAGKGVIYTVSVVVVKSDDGHLSKPDFSLVFDVEGQRRACYQRHQETGFGHIIAVRRHLAVSPVENCAEVLRIEGGAGSLGQALHQDVAQLLIFLGGQ